VTTAVRSILANASNSLEIVVVDQSNDDRTLLALAELSAAGALRYVRVAGKGSAAARNNGIAEARAEIIGLIDDDCEAPPDWISELAEAFGRDGRIGVVFGNVVPAAHDPAAGFIPAHIGDHSRVARSIREKHWVDGMAACMGLRHSVWRALGGFDTMLGSGAPLRSAAEGDFALRALTAGWFVSSSPALHVVHHGFRGWTEGRRLIHSYWYGTGAMAAKAVKQRQPGIVPHLARLASRWAVGRSPVAASLGKRGYRLLRLTAFLQGFGAGMRTPVDAASGQYSAWRTQASAH
jgi:GT2 family glycosyltransferase